MTIEEIKELLRIFNESGVAELELQRGENRLRIRRGGSGLELSMPVAMPAAVAAPVAVAAAPAPVAAPPPPPPAPVAVSDDGTLVKSPIVGTFYECPSPGAPPFVKVGDTVEKGQVLCIIESMKLMNEIESEVAGTITARLVENGRPVEYGEALFRVRPR